VESSVYRNPQWYVDRYGCLHFEVNKQYFKGEVYIGSAKIKTYEKGSYPMEIVYNVISYEYKEIKKEIGNKITKHLVVRVEPKEANAKGNESHP
jgi:hypothetical protein